jgi:hypothetical protein
MRVLNRPARASTWLLGEVLRAEARALTEVGKLAQALGSIIDDTLGGEREPAMPQREAGTRDVGDDTRAPGDAWLEPIPGSSRADRPPRREGGGPVVTSAPPASLAASPPSERPTTAASSPLSAEPSFEGGGHVDEQAVLVSESADPGAQDGAGASVHVREPWSGYRTMRAPEIVDRLPALSDEVLSLLVLYETKPGRARRTVLEAAQRELERRAA